MIKLRTIGGLERVIVNPVLTAAAEVENNTFVVDGDDVYLVANTLSGDDAYKEGVKFKAGEYLNGYLLNSIVGLEIVVDSKHITYAEGADYDDIAKGDIITIDSSGKLEVVEEAPDSGLYFIVTAKTRLTEKALVLKILYAVESGSAGATTLGELTDVDLTTPPTDGQVLGYNGTSWTAADDKVE